MIGGPLLSPEAHEAISRALRDDTGPWALWFYAVVDGRMRLTATSPSRTWTERELAEDVTRYMKLRPVGMLLSPFTYAYVAAREIALCLASQEAAHAE